MALDVFRIIIKFDDDVLSAAMNRVHFGASRWFASRLKAIRSELGGADVRGVEIVNVFLTERNTTKEWIQFGPTLDCAMTYDPRSMISNKPVDNIKSLLPTLAEICVSAQWPQLRAIGRVLSKPLTPEDELNLECCLSNESAYFDDLRSDPDIGFIILQKDTFRLAPASGSSEEKSWRLSAEQADRICRKFLPIGDMIFDCAVHLQERGFWAAAEVAKHNERFCKDASELENYHRFLKEKASFTLAHPWPFYATPEDVSKFYYSRLMGQLSAWKTRQIGVDDDSHPDPWEKERELARDNNPVEFAQRRIALEQALKEVRKQEVLLHATGLGRKYTFDETGWCKFYTAVMERDAALLGFQFDQSRSSHNFPVFTKNIAENWDLCWALERNFEGGLAPDLEFRHRSIKGKLDKEASGEFLLIRHRTIIPGFPKAYWTFRDLDELEVIIKANLCLYEQIAPILEGGLCQVLVQ